MSWWKILIFYFLLLGALLWFMHRSRCLREDGEESQGD
jgi:hypothetical protein